MSLRDARAALFRDTKPNFRVAEKTDMHWLWAAHRMSAPDSPMSQSEFTQWVVSFLRPFDVVWIAEDVNHKLEQGKGPVGVFYADYDDWNLVPHVDFFPWASPRNKVRTVVGFCLKHRFHPGVGCIRLSVSRDQKRYFARMDRYIPIRLIGKIAGGRREGDDYLFTIRGKAHG